MDELARWAGIDLAVAAVRESARATSPAETVELAKGGLIEIGAHTISHPSLPALSPAQQVQEIAGCRAKLREMIGGDVTSFAFPYGDHDERTAAAVADAGYQCGCVCRDTIVTPRCDRYVIPRLDVLDWDGDTLAARLEGRLRG
jgi:peptidoglycan/xylan/chitin deacetylase (PgdA/CDA1 family)